MGAIEFSTIAFGKTAAEAFQNARREAQFHQGNEGYTGTIAEKDSFILVDLPKGVTVERVLEWARAAERLEYVLMVLGNPHYSAERKKQARKELTKLNNQLSRRKRELVQRIVDLSMKDKWGPCLCLEFKGAENTRVKAKNGKKGKRGSFFYFAGLASY